MKGIGVQSYKVVEYSLRPHPGYFQCIFSLVYFGFVRKASWNNGWDLNKVCLHSLA